jgi:hypothetical protein
MKRQSKPNEEKGAIKFYKPTEEQKKECVMAVG